MEGLKDLLLETALKSKMATPYACVIVHRNKILSTGFNDYDMCRLCNSGKDPRCIL